MRQVTIFVSLLVSPVVSVIYGVMNRGPGNGDVRSMLWSQAFIVLTAVSLAWSARDMISLRKTAASVTAVAAAAAATTAATTATATTTAPATTADLLPNGTAHDDNDDDANNYNNVNVNHPVTHIDEQEGDSPQRPTDNLVTHIDVGDPERSTDNDHVTRIEEGDPQQHPPNSHHVDHLGEDADEAAVAAAAGGGGGGGGAGGGGDTTQSPTREEVFSPESCIFQAAEALLSVHPGSIADEDCALEALSVTVKQVPLQGLTVDTPVLQTANALHAWRMVIQHQGQVERDIRETDRWGTLEQKLVSMNAGMPFVVGIAQVGQLFSKQARLACFLELRES